MSNKNTFIENLKQRLAQPLPGREAQLRMAFANRAAQLRLNPEPPQNARTACVSLLLWEKNETWHTILIQRSPNPMDRHSGQISFPGGKHEQNDGSLVNTALREAQEEIGIQPGQVEVLGQLTDLYIPVSNFNVFPFVGVLSGNPEFLPQPGEVETILAPAISHFQKPENKSAQELVVGTGVRLQDVPCFLIEDKVVWGATAMIISEFLELLS